MTGLGIEGAPAFRRFRWTDRPIVALGVIALSSGFGQFGVVAALGDVAKAFGVSQHTATVADQTGLSGTELGIGLAIIRIVSLAALPVSGMADRFGRRRILLVTVSLGLAFTAFAAASPSYWWFVGIFACGRPLLSTTNALAQVMAAEHTGAVDRAKSVALVTAGYAAGAGITAVVHSLGLSGGGFRLLFVLALVPLLFVLGVRHWVVESDRFSRVEATGHALPVLGAVERRFLARLVVVATIAFSLSVISGPGNSFVFLYAEDVVHQPGVVTAGMVVAAGVVGLAGLLLGRWLSDHVGRRPTGAIGMVAAGGFSLLAYSAGEISLVVGYVGGVLAGAVLAPALGALVNELFPTSVRASVAGWWVASGVVGASVGLVIFGTLAGGAGGFSAAGFWTFVPITAASALFWLVPETRGKEPEELSPEGEGHLLR